MLLSLFMWEPRGGDHASPQLVILGIGRSLAAALSKGGLVALELTRFTSVPSLKLQRESSISDL